MKNKKHHFFALISRMKYINRWGLMRNTCPENIQEHSLQVAVIAHALAVIKNVHFGGSLNAERAALLAIFHDSNEIITGDLPTPIKYYNPDIKEAYHEVEEISKTKLMSMLPEELGEVYRSLFFEQEEEMEYWALVKAADRISAYLKCIEEEKAGNSEFKKAKASAYESIMQIGRPEVKYFMETFVPSFSLTLDELD